MATELWEAGRFWQWATARLQADNAAMAALPGGIHYYAAPATAGGSATPLPTPFLVYQRPAPGVDVRSASASVRYEHRGRYVTKISGPLNVAGGMAAIVAAADNVSRVLDVQRGVAGADGNVLACVRDGDFELPEYVPPSGDLWLHVLLYWLAWTQPLNE